METTNILKCVELLVVGSSIATILLKLPKRVLENLGEYISPNWLSVIHTPIVWIGYAIYCLGGVWIDIGFQIVIIGAMLDRVDGKIAAVFDKKYECIKREPPTTFWEAMAYRGKSEWGEVIDPAADKIAIAPLFIYVGYDMFVQAFRHDYLSGEHLLLFISATAIAAILSVDLLGTVIRMDAFKWLLKRKGATWAGKSKALFQWIWLMLYMPYEQGWISKCQYNYMIFLDIFLVVVLALGIISLVTKMVDFLNWLTKFFGHSVE